MIGRARLIAIVALAFGCARSADTSNVPDDEDLPAVDAAVEAPPRAREASDEEPADAQVPADDAAEHISFDGPDAEPAMPDQIVAPPTRPSMPSMMTDVLKKGPRR